MFEYVAARIAGRIASLLLVMSLFISSTMQCSFLRQPPSLQQTPWKEASTVMP
jgi:hypothetical protein